MRVQVQERRINGGILFASFRSNDVAFRLGFPTWIKQVFPHGAGGSSGVCGPGGSGAGFGPSITPNKNNKKSIINLLLCYDLRLGTYSSRGEIRGSIET